jgi:hypothetical protein
MSMTTIVVDLLACRRAATMPEASPRVCHTTIRPDPPTSTAVPVGQSPSGDIMDILDDEVLISSNPDRPRGTIRVKLVHSRRSAPIPVENPWSE